MKRTNSSSCSSSSSSSIRYWSISEESLRRYVQFASEGCIQELLSASSDDESSSWKKVTTLLNPPGMVEISKKRTSGSLLHTYRSRCCLLSPQHFLTVANAIDAAKQWDSDLVEAKYIKDIDDNISIIRLRYGGNAKPLFRNREFIVYERRQTMEDGTLVVAVASLPKEIAAGILQPPNQQKKKKKNNTIRGFLLQSGWVVETLQQQHQHQHQSCCAVTYVVQLDPAGWLPKCFVNRLLNTKLVMIIQNLHKLVQTTYLPDPIP